MPRAAALLIVSSLLLLGAERSAHADDWLAVLPECAHGPEASALGRMALLYPRPGLPAVVVAGDRLIARVRVPSGLTPPPGVQQDRALRGWSAVLLGYSTPLGSPVEHGYALRVSDVRPDGASSLVYRATVRIPEWTAPGTYGLRLSAPGGRDVVGSAVRVVAAGAEVRVALLGGIPGAGAPGAARAREALEILARLPVDVWITRESPSLLATLRAAPLPARAGGGVGGELPAVLALPEEGLAAVVRHGEEGLELGRCDTPHLRFADLLAHLRREGLRLRPLGVRDLPGSERYALLGGPDRPVPGGPGPAVVPVPGGSGLSVQVPATLGGAAELTVVVPDDGRATRVRGGSGGWWPATPVGATGAVPTLALRLTVAAGATARLTRASGQPLRLTLSPTDARTETGVPVALRARSSRRSERVVWVLDEDRTAVGEGATVAFLPLGLHRVRALAITADGVAAAADARVTVTTREGTGSACRVGLNSQGGPLELLPVLLLLVQRLRRRRRE